MPSRLPATIFCCRSKMLAETSAYLAEAQAVYGENNANVRKYRNQVSKLEQRIEEDVTAFWSHHASYNSASSREQLQREPSIP